MGFLGMVFVVLLLSVTAVFITVTLSGSLGTKQMRETTRKGEVLRAAITTYTLGHGGATGSRPPTLDALVTMPGGDTACAADRTAASATFRTLQGWCGPYVDRIFSEAATDYKTDGWGTEFSYTQATNTLRSCGSNRTCGDSDDVSF